MADFTLEYETIEEDRDYAVIISKFANNAEQRRLRHDKKLIGFILRSPALQKAQWAAHQAFFDSKEGALTAFTFESPFDDVTYTVRYRVGKFKSSYKNGIFTLSWEFEVL